MNGANLYSKRSFLKLPAPIDVDALLADYRSIPAAAWIASYWDVHCSISMLLLRGGQAGTGYDFTTTNVADSELLKKLPYMSWLLSESGPFGQSTYAFIFRTKPSGVALAHIDDDIAWKEPFRIHVPLETNDGAFLLSEGRSKHIPVGEAWTFDNQKLHAAVNGDTVRTHLIFDVPRNPSLDRLLEAAEFDPGDEDPKNWARVSFPEPVPILTPATFTALSVKEKIALQLNPDGFASRVEKPRLAGRIGGSRLLVGDIVYSVDGVDECDVALTPMNYLRLRCRPGDKVKLGIIRGDRRLTESFKIYRHPAPAFRKIFSRLRSAMA